MHHHIAKIRDDPMARRQAVNGVGPDAMFLLQPVAEFADDGLQVRLAAAGTDHEKIGEARQAAQIERDEVLGFFVRGNGRAELG
jgi:hypothetical protein